MNESRHLTDEALLLQAGKRLRPAKEAETLAHIEECAECRARFQQTRVAHAILANLSDLGLDEVRQRSRGSQRRAPLRQHRFPFLPVGGIIMASAVVLIILFVPSIVTDVRASELLNRAAAGEQSITLAPGYNLRVDGSSCATVRGGRYLAQVSQSSKCGTVLAHIRNTVWSKGNPLSAVTFRAWHNSLPHRKDTLDHKSKEWVLRTSSEAGSIRFATLDLREPDLRPTELTVHFADDAELNVSEDFTPTETIAVNVPGPVQSPTAPSAVVNNLPDSNDLLEVRAWQALRDLHADSGWEATVLRSGSTIVIRAVTDTTERKNELQTNLAALAPVEVHIQTADETRGAVDFLPQRSFPAPGEALAESWIESHFHSSFDQNSFKNQVVKLSGNLLGHALFIDRLKQRQFALSHCSCAADLNRLTLMEEAELRSQQAVLLAALAPILDVTPSPGGKIMTMKEAMRMDLIVQELLISSGGSSVSLETQLSSLRELLGVTKNSSAPNTQSAALSM